MSEDSIIREAQFDPKVKTYWLLSGAIVFVITIVGIPLLLLWFPLGYLFTGRYLGRMSCTLTGKALKVKKGVLVRVEKTIPLEKITDMALVQGPLMRAFGISRLSVETAGQSGAGSLVNMTGIVESESFREAVLAQRDQLAATPATDAPAPPETPTDTRTLQELRDGVLRIEQLLETLARRDGP